MRGHYEAFFQTAEQARQASATVSAAINRGIASGNASATVNSAVKDMEGFSEERVVARVDGWTGKEPPRTNKTISSLIEAKNSFSLANGKRLEALLGEYQDLPDYKEALKEYREEGGTDVYEPLEVRPCCSVQRAMNTLMSGSCERMHFSGII